LVHIRAYLRASLEDLVLCPYHSDSVYTMVFSLDGSKLASGSDD